MNISDLPKFVPDRPFSRQSFGASAIVTAMGELADGKVELAKFAVCSHPNDGGLVEKIFVIGFVDISDGTESPQQFCFRYCNKENDPNGAGSHSVIGSDHSFSDDPAYAAAELAFKFARLSECVFRIAV